MTHVATLIAPDNALDDSAVERARALLPNVAPLQWLAPHKAIDIPFSADTPGSESALTRELHDAVPAADVVVQRADYRRKRLFLADMDSTMIGQECIDELADMIGIKPQVAAITERAMRGEIDFAPALRERVALLKGVPQTVIAEILDKRITLTPGARTLVQTMRKHGTHTCLVTGGFTAFAEAIAKQIGFDEIRANRLELDPDARLNGLVAEPIFGREAKHAALIELRGKFGLKPEETLAVGDGANDLDMIGAAGLGVAYCAKPKVAEAAAARIDRNDLTSLLYAQGYRRDEFVTAG